jgi:hypothetical protein
MANHRVKDFKEMLNRKLAIGKKELAGACTFDELRRLEAEFGGLFLGISAARLVLGNNRDRKSLQMEFDAAWARMEEIVMDSHKKLKEKGVI